MSVIALLLLIVTLGAAKQYTDEDLARFPKLFHLDDYDRCLARPDGVYCLGTFDLSPAKLPHPTYDMIKAYSENEPLSHFNRTRIHRGYCVSLRCPTRNTASILSDNNSTLHRNDATLDYESNATFRFQRCVDHYAKVNALRATLRTLQYCKTHDEKVAIHPPTSAETLYIQIIYAVIVVNIIGTIYDVYTEDGPNTSKNKLLSAFSIPANWRRLTVIRDSIDPRQTSVIPIEGIRVIALGFTTYAHACVFHYAFYIINPEFLEACTHRPDGIYLTSGTALIHGFVMISCFLTGYSLLLWSQNYELGLHLLPLAIIKRFIRITPVHLLIVGYAATWWPKSRDGPLVSSTIGLESEACKKKFWSHVFLINNMVDIKEYCVTPTWFLPVIMHMYIVACTFTLLFWRRRCVAVKLYTYLLAASCLLIGVIAYLNDYKSIVQFLNPEQTRRVFRDSPSFTHLYVSSWGALPACFIGLILAYIQYELEAKKIDLSNFRWFVYLHYILLPVMFTWALIGIYLREIKSPVFNSVLVALDKPFFCALMAIFLLGLFHVDGPIRKFYSWRGWRIMARMSLTVMMLHWCINMTIRAKPMAYGTSTLDMIVDWCATNFLTYAAAVPITILVEIPMQRFFEALLF